MDFFSETKLIPESAGARRGGGAEVTWREIAARLTEDFMDWGCRFSRKQLQEIAVTYECTPLFFWEWLDGERDRSEKGFLRVLGYAWRKCRESEGNPPAGRPAAIRPDGAAAIPADPTGKGIAA